MSNVGHIFAEIWWGYSTEWMLYPNANGCPYEGMILSLLISTAGIDTEVLSLNVKVCSGLISVFRWQDLKSRLLNL